MEQKPTLLLLRGLPFSGKTDYALQWVDKDPLRRVRVSWSDIMLSLGSRHNAVRRILAFEGACHVMLAALRDGVSVCLDEENLDGLTWGVFATRAAQLGARVEWHTMPTTAAECERRAAEVISDEQTLRRAVTDIRRKADVFAALLK